MENIEIRFPNMVASNDENVDTNIKIGSVGGAGTNAVTGMITENISGVEVNSGNTDNGR